MIRRSRTSPVGKAGGSAFAHYETQRRAWIRRNRRAFLILDGVVALVTVASLAVLLRWPATGWYAGLAAGMTLCFDLSARLNPPPWIEQWQQGGLGEQRTGEQLATLGSPWLVLHDQRRPDRNVDHIVVGPPGVFVLESKNLTGRIRVDGDQVTVTRPDGRTGYTTTKPPRQARGNAAALNRQLTSAGAGCWVHAVVVLWGDVDEDIVQGRGVYYVHGRALTGWLTSHPPTDPRRVNRARTALSPTNGPTPTAERTAAA